MVGSIAGSTWRKFKFAITSDLWLPFAIEGSARDGGANGFPVTYLGDVFVNRDKTHRYVTRNTRIRANGWPAITSDQFLAVGRETVLVQNLRRFSPTGINATTDQHKSLTAKHAYTHHHRRIDRTHPIPVALSRFHFRPLKYTQGHHRVAAEPPATRIGVVGGSGAAI